MKVKKSNDFLSPEVRQTINDLKGCFVYNKNRLIYSERTQEKVSEYLLKLCDLVGYFDKSIKKEKEVIKSELYYIFHSYIIFCKLDSFRIFRRYWLSSRPS